jgi:membrane fusion protein, multidrug efflux system
MSAQVAEREIIARPPARHASISRKQLGLAGGALLLGMGAAWYGNHWWTVGRFIETTDDAYVGGDVTVIAPKVSGFIADVAITDNQSVHAGDLLVKLDDRDYRAALAKAVAAVAGQQATLANLEAVRRLQEAMIAQANAELTATAAGSPAPSTMSSVIAAWRRISLVPSSAFSRRTRTI